VLETKTIVSQLPKVVSEYLFVQIAEQVEWLNRNVGALELAFEQAPEVFESVGVNLPVNVRLRVVYDLMLESLVPESLIGHKRIGVNRASRLDVSANGGLEQVLLTVAYDGGPDFATTLQDAHDSHFVLSASLSNPALSFIGVHETGRATDEGFVYFDFFTIAAKLDGRAGLHRKTNPVEHEPCGLLGDAKSAANFVGTYAVLAVGNHPNSDKPFIERQCRILKDSPYLSRELPFGVEALALPLPLILEEYGILAATGRAHHDAVGPAQPDHKVKAVIGVREVDDCLLEGSGLFHVSHLNQLSHTVLICQVYYHPCKYCIQTV